MNIKNKVAVITGAAGGIGHAVAVELARRGARSVALVDHSDSVLQVAADINTAKRIQPALSDRAVTPWGR